MHIFWGLVSGFLYGSRAGDFAETGQPWLMICLYLRYQTQLNKGSSKSTLCWITALLALLPITGMLKNSLDCSL